MVSKLNWLNPTVAKFIEKRLKSIPFVKAEIDKQYAGVLAEIQATLRPYTGEFETYESLPKKGRTKEEILEEMREFKKREDGRWEDGFVSGAVYHGDKEHIEFLNEVYALNSQSNPLHSDLWPSATKFEAEIIAMTATMLGGTKVEDEVCGSVSSGGTESILLAMKSYRDKAYDERWVTQPEMLVPETAHAAFDKASKFFGIKMVKIPVDKNFRADIKAAKNLINRNTIVVVGSAPSYPHGIIDPIPELAALAKSWGIGCHVDCCLGGFVLPFAEKLGYDVPPFDFRVPGVTSISADTHKYGYAAKGTSVVLYRTPELRRYQYYTTTEWPGGLYFSPTLAGSRPGGLSAACWASMLSIGEEGYMEATQKILNAAQQIKDGLAEIPELYVLGDPLWVIAFNSEKLDIYRIMDFMTKKHWNLNGLHKPACIHIAVTLRHTQEGVIDRFLQDLQEAVDFIKANPAKKEDGGMAPVYGMASSLPFRGMISDILELYMNAIYKV